MIQISWPMAIILVAAVLVSGGLAALHIISVDWIEHTLTGIIGFVLGHSLGILRVRREPQPPHRPPPATPVDSSVLVERLAVERERKDP